MQRSFKHIARLVLLTFVLSLGLPFFAVYDTSGQALAKKPASIFGETILICTGDGFKWVKWADLQSGKEKRHTPSHYKCALCYLHAHGMKDIALPDTAALSDATYPPSDIFVYGHGGAASHLDTGLYSRAPPVFLL